MKDLPEVEDLRVRRSGHGPIMGVQVVSARGDNKEGPLATSAHDGPPRVSIGLPLYNAERYLTQAFDSLLAQDYEDVEIIVSDNASTDRTWQICEDYAGRDARIRLYRNSENMGAAYNYNRTLELARGELFKWAAYDDICAPHFVCSCVEELDRAGPGTVLVYPRTILIDDQGAEVGPYRDGLHLQSSRPHLRLAAFARNLSLCNAVFGILRTDVLRRTGLIRPYVSSDVVLLAELAALGEFHEVPEQLFFRRIHAGSSRQGTGDLISVARWFDPRRRDGATRSKPRTAGHVARTLFDTDLPVLERVRCAVVFLTVWGARKAHIRGSHLKHGFLGSRVPASIRASNATHSTQVGRLDDRTQETTR